MIDSGTIIVIGAGHNGLVCANYLARGLKRSACRVLVLEARDAVGGSATTRCFKDKTGEKEFRVSGIAHVLHSLDPAICKSLGLNAVGFEPGENVETVSLGREGEHLTLGANTVSGNNLTNKDRDAYAQFKKEFRAYATALTPLMTNKPPRLKNMDRRDLKTLAKLGWRLRFGLGAASMLEFLRVGGINIYDVLNEEIDDEHLKAALAVDAVLGHNMGPRTPGTVLTYLHRLQGELHSAQTLPPGGMGKISQALADAALGAGVEIRTGAKVERIIVENGVAKGVLLETGEQIAARWVVSNADAKTTFLKLVGMHNLDAMFTHRIRKTRTNGSVAKLHLGLSKLPLVQGLSLEQHGQRLLIAPDMRYIERAFNHSKYGEFSQHPVLEVTLPSIADCSLAPDDCHVMSVVASYAPYALDVGWDRAREAFTNRVVSKLEEYFPGLSEHIVASELLTPVDMEREYHNTGGHWHHGELSIDQSFMMRPVHGVAQYDAPVEGLFLCGASCHPGGGVSGAPGRIAAARMLAMGVGK